MVLHTTSTYIFEFGGYKNDNRLTGLDGRSGFLYILYYTYLACSSTYIRTTTYVYTYKIRVFKVYKKLIRKPCGLGNNH